MEERPGGGFGAIDARSELDDIQVNLEYPPLRPEQRNLRRQPCLGNLANRIAARPEKQIFCRLLRNRAGAARPFPVLPGLVLAAHGLEVEAKAFLAEQIVLRRDNGLRQLSLI